MCPNGTATGSTYFLPLEEQLETRIIERGYLESKMVGSWVRVRWVVPDVLEGCWPP